MSEWGPDSDLPVNLGTQGTAQNPKARGTIPVNQALDAVNGVEHRGWARHTFSAGGKECRNSDSHRDDLG